MNTLINIEMGIIAIIGECYSVNTVQLKNKAYHFDFDIQYGNGSMTPAHIQVDWDAHSAIKGNEDITNIDHHLLSQLQVTEPNAMFYDKATRKPIDWKSILLEKSKPDEFEGEFKFE